MLKVVTIIGKDGCQRCREALEKASSELNTVAIYREFATLPLAVRRAITDYFRKQEKEFEYPLVITGSID